MTGALALTGATSLRHTDYGLIREVVDSVDFDGACS